MTKEEIIEVNSANWEFIRFLTREEVELTTKLSTFSNGYKAIYKCKTCGAERQYIVKQQKRAIMKCLNGCHGSIKCLSKPIVGLDDIATTHPEIAKYFVNQEETKECKIGVNTKKLLRCPNCLYEKYITPRRVLREGFSCPICSDGYSYSEKFVGGLLKQLGVEFKPQYSIDGRKRYDFYLPVYSCIIETHGTQHYEEVKRGRTLKEEQENDRYKKELALSSGIEHYIVLDCRDSTHKWIKNSILSSELVDLLNFNEDDIDWKEIEMLRNGSLFIEVINYYIQNSDNTNTVKIGEIFGICDTTVGKYLQRGEELGLCEYNRYPRQKYVVIKDDEVLCVGTSRELREFLNYKDATLINRIALGKGKFPENIHMVKHRKLGCLEIYYSNSEELKNRGINLK